MASAQRASGANGVLPISAIQQKNAPPTAPRGQSNKATAPRLKVVVRRLAPGLTQAEFEAAIGSEWKVGSGRVDWYRYAAGKISRDAAKPSRPSRAYFYLTDKAHLVPLAEKVRQTTFNDAKNSARDPALIGPPTTEFAPFNRIPGGRRRNDARQGTIDQDPEFKDFLESLTNPAPKPAAPEPGAEVPPPEKEKITTTPLIEALREKKAQKDKPSAKSGKHGRTDSRDEKSEKVGDKKILSKAKESGAANDKGRKTSRAEREKATKEAVKALGKEAAKQSAKGASEPAVPAAASPAPERKRERGNASMVAKVLQRDLGLVPAGGRRRGGAKREGAADSTSSKPADTSAPATSTKDKEKSASPAPSNKAPATTAPNQAASTPRSPKKDSRPSRAERRNQKAALAEKTSQSPSATPEPSKNSKTPSAPAPTILKKSPNSATQSQQAPKAPAGPAATRNANIAPASPAAAAKASPAKQQAASDSAKTAFLKHANASQGITEPLIQEALSQFGSISKVEIDKRKGFAYVDFADADGLRKAIAASPVKVAQGAVQILEKRERVGGRLAPPASVVQQAIQRDQQQQQQQQQQQPPVPNGPRNGGGSNFRSGRGPRGSRGGGRSNASAAPVATEPAAPSASGSAS